MSPVSGAGSNPIIFQAGTKPPAKATGKPPTQSQPSTTASADPDHDGDTHTGGVDVKG